MCVRATICRVEKAVRITYYECVFVAVAIQHTERMRRIILSSVASLALPRFSTVSHKNGKNFGEKLLTIKMGSYFLYKLCSDIRYYKLFIVKDNLLPVNTTIILIIIVLVLIHN